MPTETPPAAVKRIAVMRLPRSLGPVLMAGELGLPASTVHAEPTRCRLNRLSRLEWVTDEPIPR